MNALKTLENWLRKPEHTITGYVPVTEETTMIFRAKSEYPVTDEIVCCGRSLEELASFLPKEYQAF